MSSLKKVNFHYEIFLNLLGCLINKIIICILMLCVIKSAVAECVFYDLGNWGKKACLITKAFIDTQILTQKLLGININNLCFSFPLP